MNDYQKGYDDRLRLLRDYHLLPLIWKVEELRKSEKPDEQIYDLLLKKIQQIAYSD